MRYRVHGLGGWAGPLRAGLLVVAITLAHMAPASAQPGPSVQDVARDLGLQQNLPAGDKVLPTPPSENWQWLSFLAGDFVRIVFFAAIFAGIVFALWTIRDRLPALGRRRLVANDKATGQTGNASIEEMIVAQAEADDLARQGHLAEAMHALLLRSLTELRKRLNLSFADSLTSREILGAITLSEAGKQSLADIIGRVEFVYFGDREAGEPDYAACRESYRRLIQAMQAGLPERLRS